MSGYLRQTTPPASGPVTTAEIKTQLRIDHSDEDTYLDGLIVAARAMVESRTGRQLLPATWTLGIDDWPRQGSPIELRVAPFRQVTSVQYVDDQGATQTLASSLYRVVSTDAGAEIWRAYDVSWPTVRSVAQAVTVVFDAGYDDASSVPAPLIHAIKFVAGAWYETREAVVIEQGVNVARTPEPAGFEALIGPYRLF